MQKFIISKPSSVTINVKIKAPNEKGAGYVDQVFPVTIKKLYGDDRTSFLDGLADVKDGDIIKSLVSDLPNVYDGDGNEMPFGDELLEQITGIDYIAAPLARECVMVQDEALRKALTEKN